MPIRGWLLLEGSIYYCGYVNCQNGGPGPGSRSVVVLVNNAALNKCHSCAATMCLLLIAFYTLETLIPIIDLPSIGISRKLFYFNLFK